MNYENDAALGISATEFTRNAAAAELFGKKFNDLSEYQKQETLLKMVEDGNKLSGALGQAAREGDGLENVIGNFKQAWENLKVALGEPILDIAIAGIKMLTDIINGFDVSRFTSAFETLKSNVSVNGEGIRAAAEQAFNGLKSVIETVMNYVAPFVQSQVEKIKQFWSENGQQILQAAQNAFNGIKAVIDFVMPAVKFVIDYIWTAIKNVITGALDVIMGVIKTFSSLLTGDWKGLWEGIKQILSGAVDLILGIMSLTFVGGIRTALTNLAKTAINLVKGKWTNIVNLFKSSTSASWATVKTWATNLINSIKSMATNAVSQVKTMGTNIVNAIKDVPSKFLQIGKDIMQGLINGLKSLNPVKFVGEIASSLVTSAKAALGIRSPSRKFIGIGEDTIRGLIVGLKNMQDGAIAQVDYVMHKLIEVADAAADEMAARQEKLADDLSAINEKTYQSVLKIQQKAAKERRKLTETELAQIKKLEDDYRKEKVNLEKKAAEDSAKIYNTLEKNRLEAIQQHIDDQKSLGLLNVAQEAEIWRQYVVTFDEGSRERIKAQQNLNSALDAVNKERLDKIQQFISDKKSLEELSLVDEVRVWEESLVLFDEGTKERITAQQNYKKAVESVQKEITSINEYYTGEITRINNDLIKKEEELTKAYEDAVSSRAQSLYNFAGLFDQVTISAEISGQQLLANLASQVVAMEDWAASMQSLAARGIDEGLVAELQAMGPKAIAEIQALNTLTDQELDAYNELWRQKSALAVEQATKELAPMKDEMQNSITEMREAAASELDALQAEWIAKMEGLTAATSSSLSSLESVGAEAGAKLLSGLSGMEGPIVAKASEIGASIAAAISAAVSAGEAAAASATQKLTNAVKKTTKKEMDINSPSEEMKKLGGYVSEGYAIGISAGVSNVRSAASELAQTIKDTVRYDMYNPKDKDAGAAEAATDSMKDALKERLDAEKDYIEKRKRLRQMSLTEELAAYEEFIQSYAKGTEQYIYYEEKIQDVKQEIYDTLIDLNDDYADKIRKANDQMHKDLLKAEEDYEKNSTKIKENAAKQIQQLQDAYTDAYNTRKKELTDYVGLFDKVTKKEGVTGKRLMIALQSQVDTFKKWQGNLDDLAKKGIDGALLDELRAMGPSAATEIAALNSLSSKELSEYSSLWREKSALASKQASKELSGLKADTAAKIAAINNETAKQLEEQRLIFEQSTATIRENTASQLDLYAQEWQTAVSKVKDGTKGEFNAMVEEMPTIGQNVIEGMMQGLADMAPSLVAQANAIAESIKSTIQAALDIHSPSRWARNFIMGNLAKGFVLGANDNEGAISGAAGKMAEWLKPDLKFNPAIVNSTGLYAGRLGVPSSITNSNSSVHTDQSKHVNATFNINGGNNTGNDVKRAWRELTFKMGV